MQRAANATVAFQLLGQFGLVLADKPSQLLTITAPRHRALLGYLALHKEGVSRDQLAELLWGDRPDRQARQSLRQAIIWLSGRISRPRTFDFWKRNEISFD